MLVSIDIHMIYTKGEVDFEQYIAGKRGKENTKERVTRASWETFSVFVEKNDFQTACIRSKQWLSHHSFLCYH